MDIYARIIMLVRKSTLLIGWFGLVGLAYVARLGTISDALILATALAMAVSLLSAHKLPARARWVMVGFISLLLLYLALTATHVTPGGLKNTVSISVSATVFAYFVSNARKFAASDGTWKVLASIAIFIAVFSPLLDRVEKNTTSGVVAYLLLSAGVLAVARSRRPARTGAIFFFAVGAIAFGFGHRVLAGLGLLAAPTYIILAVFPSRFLRMILLSLAVGGIVFFVALYTGLWGLDARSLDALFVEYSGRNAASGRQIIWPIIMASVAERPWDGLGTGATFASLYPDKPWSAHNYFLQTYLQTGLLGLVSLLFLLLTIWMAIGRPKRSEKHGIYLSVAYVVLLINMAFEVFLMQVSLYIGLSAWMMLGLGIGLLGPRPHPTANMGKLKRTGLAVHAAP